MRPAPDFIPCLVLAALVGVAEALCESLAFRYQAELLS